MAELLEVVTSWPSLLLVLLVFGFAPGFCLRLIVLAYPRDDPRRTELIAELYAVPRIQRPLWVAEQLEVALFEGLVHRVLAVLRRLASWDQARGWMVPPIVLMAVMSTLAIIGAIWTLLHPGDYSGLLWDLVELSLEIGSIGLSLLTARAISRWRKCTRRAAQRTDSKE